jgi:hypothetical protein
MILYVEELGKCKSTMESGWNSQFHVVLFGKPHNFVESL